MHVSAHAIDCPGFPSLSLVLLSDGPAAMAAFDGLRLHGTLVVFSACGAAAGEQRGQEGVVGLVEGAFAAGARTVVAPIGEVNQQATCDVMTQFHAELVRGGSPAGAMQLARRTLAATPNYAAAHYWGQFAVFGPLPSSDDGTGGTGGRWLWGAGVGAAVSVALFWDRIVAMGLSLRP